MKILNTKKFMFHMQYMHGVKSNFTCSQEGCSRVFHRKAVLLQHIRQKHGKSTNVKDNDFKTKAEISHSNRSTVFDIIQSDIQTSSSKSPDQTESKVNKSNKFYSNFCSEISNAVQQFISQLYDNVTMTKFLIQKIITSMISFLNSNFISIIVECVESIIAHNSEQQKLIDLLKSMLQTVQSSFDSLDNEYKRQNYFQSCPFCVKPVEVKVGTSPDRSTKQNCLSLTLKPNTQHTCR